MNPAKPAGRAQQAYWWDWGQTRLEARFLNSSHPFPRLGTRSAGMPQSSSCQLQNSTDTDSKAPRRRRNHVSQAAWLWIRRERRRQQGLLHTSLHQTTSQVGKEQGKRAPREHSRAGRKGNILQAQCWQDLLGWLHSCPVGTAQGCSMPHTYHLLPLVKGQGSSQLMENSDMSNFIGFVQLGLKPNSMEALGWPQKPMF